MTKNYIAFLQTTQRPTSSPFRATDKLVCVVPTGSVRVAMAKLRKLMQAEYDHDTEFRDTKSVSILRLMELTQVPAEGIVVHHEVMIEQPTLVGATIKNGVRNVRLQEKDKVVGKA